MHKSIAVCNKVHPARLLSIGPPGKGEGTCVPYALLCPAPLDPPLLLPQPALPNPQQWLTYDLYILLLLALKINMPYSITAIPDCEYETVKCP